MYHLVVCLKTILAIKLQYSFINCILAKEIADLQGLKAVSIIDKIYTI
jgi:hypothetical protein